jgi:cell division transport system permease protein
MSVLTYAFREALVSLRRSGRSAALSMGTIAVAFLTLGGFLLASANLQSVVDEWAAAAEMSVFLRDDHDPALRAAIIDELQRHFAVVGVEFVSQEQALERFRVDFPELADVAASAGNAFPPSIEVRLRTDPASTGAAEALAQQLSERDGVVDVRYDRQWLARLLAVIRSIQVAGLVIAGVLMLGAAFTVTAVVRLSLQARRDELDIMELVGAPFTYIRGPAVAEGTLLGAIGALLSLAVLWVVFSTMRTEFNELAAAWGSAGDLRFLSWRDAALLLITGVIVGAFAGMIAARASHTLNAR